MPNKSLIFILFAECILRPKIYLCLSGNGKGKERAYGRKFKANIHNTFLF